MTTITSSSRFTEPTRVWVSAGLAPPLADHGELSPSSRQKLARISCAHMQLQFRHARGLLRHALRRSGSGLGLNDLDDSGPAPRLAHPWRLSLSHSNGLHAAVCAPATLGLDVERLDRPIAAHRLAARLLPSAECAWVNAGPAPQLRFLKLWTAREAAFKAGLIPLVSGGPEWIRAGLWQAPFACRHWHTANYLLSVVGTAALPPLQLVRIGAAQRPLQA